MAGMNDGIIKRGGTWCYVIRVPDPLTGLSKPKWVGGFESEDAAKAARDEARVAARRGEYVNRNTVTVREYLMQWLDAHALETKPRTLASYRYLVSHYVNPRIGGLRLQAVRPSTLSALYRELLTSGGKNGRALSSRTVNYVHAVLRKALNDAVHTDQLLPSNPAERAKRPRTERYRVVDVLTPAELRLFLDLVKEHRQFVFYRLAAYTGARRGELLNLRWTDIDWKTSAIRIRGSVGIAEGKRIEGTTKGGRQRTVGIDLGTLDVLRQHQRSQAKDREVAGEAWTDSGLVLVNGLGEPIYPDSVTQLMAKVIRAYNERAKAADDESAVLLPEASPHDLRHAHATMLLSNGVPVHIVAERLGHADPSITLRVYAHVIRQFAVNVADDFATMIEDSDDDDGQAGSVGASC